MNQFLNIKSEIKIDSYHVGYPNGDNPEQFPGN